MEGVEPALQELLQLAQPGDPCRSMHEPQAASKHRAPSVSAESLTDLKHQIDLCPALFRMACRLPGSSVVRRVDGLIVQLARHLGVEFLRQRVQRRQFAYGADDFARKQAHQRRYDPSELIVPLAEIGRPIQILEEKSGGGSLRRKREQILIGPGKPLVLKSFDRLQLATQGEIRSVRLPQHGDALKIDQDG